MLVSILLLILSVVILYFGAEFSLDSSEKVGKKLGLSPLMVGMILVGFGTSLPEFFVGHIAGLQGKGSMAVGALVGSNIANMCLVLGLCGLTTHLHMAHKSIRNQLVIHFVLGLVLWFVLSSSELTVFTTSPLIFLCGIYLYMLYVDMKKDRKLKEETLNEFQAGAVFLKLFGGFGMLYLGGELLVKSGTDLCTTLGMSEYIVSAIFLALGTSFPELVTSILAAVQKKETDMIVGNIVGSNMFNCAFILGSLGIYDFSMDQTFHFEITTLIFGAFGLLLLSVFKKEFYRISGIVYISAYLAVVGYWLKFF